jgi:hypothetical protein
MNFIGQTVALSSAAVNAAAAALNVPLPNIWAVLHVETTGCGFLPDRRPVIRFERYRFHVHTGGIYDRAHPDISSPSAGNVAADGAPQYALLDKALALNPQAALQSTSWGLAQILGENCFLAGFPDIDSMIEAMTESEDAQLDAFRSFLQSAHLAGHLQAQNWAAFARGYNGADYQRNRYDTQLAAAFKTFNSGQMPDLDVRAAQLYLTLRGFSPGGIDGQLGPNTIDALSAFQASAGLPQTGQPDSQTLAALTPGVQTMIGN